eukprot:755324-Hanusia_phi.AAC.2
MQESRQAGGSQRNFHAVRILSNGCERMLQFAARTDGLVCAGVKHYVKQDPQVAFRLLKKSASLGHSLSLYVIGKAYCKVTSSYASNVPQRTLSGMGNRC